MHAFRAAEPHVGDLDLWPPTASESGAIGDRVRTELGEDVVAVESGVGGQRIGEDVGDLHDGGPAGAGGGARRRPSARARKKLNKCLPERGFYRRNHPANRGPGSRARGREGTPPGSGMERVTGLEPATFSLGS